MRPDGETTDTCFLIEAQFEPSMCGDGDERWIAFPATYDTKDGALAVLGMIMTEHDARQDREKRKRGVPVRTGLFRIVRLDTVVKRYLVALPPKVE